MKLTKKLKAKSSKPKKQKKPKKKRFAYLRTLYGKFRAWVQKIDHRQMNDRPNVVVRDEETHVCKHCGTEYTGGYCPKCSMPARWQRFNWKLLFLNFLDIWGLGNRPMFRTIRDLFWRPGYMIKDYLRGHHLSYFPPFKMLAVWTVVLVFMIWIAHQLFGGTSGVNLESINKETKDLVTSTSSITTVLLELLKRVVDYLDSHLLYRLLLLNIVVVVAVKWAFRKISDFNYVETFISQIYISCQFLIIAIANMLFTWEDPTGDILFPLSNFALVPFVLTYDFHQLYGIKWKKAFVKTLVVFINVLILFGIFFLLVVGILLIVERLTNPSSTIFSNFSFTD